MVGVFESFDFIFSAHLMLDILGHTNELSECLQRKDQDILNAMSLVRLAKSKMQQMRSRVGFISSKRYNILQQIWHSSSWNGK